MDNLLEHCSSKTDKFRALKTQTRYYGMFLNAKHLPLSNMSVQQLAENISAFLEDNFSGQDAGEEDQEHEEEDKIQGDNNSVDLQVPFQFTTQGQTVALCCDDCFYISQVLLPIRSNLAGHFYGTEGDGKHIQMARI